MTLVIMDLLVFHMKHLLQEEIVVILEKEFSTVDCCVRAYHIFKLFLTANNKVDPESLIHNKFAIALLLVVSPRLCAN